jgi:hypothetical protein
VRCLDAEQLLLLLLWLLLLLLLPAWHAVADACRKYQRVATCWLCSACKASRSASQLKGSLAVFKVSVLRCTQTNKHDGRMFHHKCFGCH